MRLVWQSLFPFPTAIPMCADLKVCPSFTPSPVMATISFFSFSALMILSLSSGSIRVNILVSNTCCSNSFSGKAISSSLDKFFFIAFESNLFCNRCCSGRAIARNNFYTYSCGVKIIQYLLNVLFRWIEKPTNPLIKHFEGE